MVIINDIAAYFWGVAFGRKIIKAKLTTLSPNKTWEGFLGALLTTVLLSIPVSLNNMDLNNIKLISIFSYVVG